MSPLHIASTLFFVGVLAFAIIAIVRTLKGA
jgi:hypothetical protein